MVDIVELNRNSNSTIVYETMKALLYALEDCININAKGECKYNSEISDAQNLIELLEMR